MSAVEKDWVIAAKLAIESFVIAGGNPNQYVADSLGFLYNNYERTNSEQYLTAILSIIWACHELGIVIDNDLVEGNTYMKMCSDENFSGGGASIGRIVRNSVSEIRAILGYWPQTPDSMWNGEKVAKDICEKIRIKKEDNMFILKTLKVEW